MNIKNLFLTLFALTLITGCGSADPTVGTGDTGTTEQNNKTAPIPTSPSQGGAVVNRVEQVGTVAYRLYFQETANGTNRKGIVLLGSGNDENAVPTIPAGSLEGGLENNTAKELAALGYVAAVVSYRQAPAIKSAKDWNDNSELMATDFSNVAGDIITKVGGGLSRDRVVTGGVSYTSYMLLTNIGMSNTLADTRGVLAACGATGDVTPQIPVYSLNCSPNPEGDFNGKALIDQITDPKINPNIKTNPQIQTDSGYFADNSCNTHCGGDTNTWTDKLVERVQVWLP